MARSVIAVMLIAAAAATLSGTAGGHPPKAPAVSHAAAGPLLSCPVAVRGLGSIAFAAGGRVELMDLRACRVRQVARSAAATVRFSADGLWLAYTRAEGGSPVVLAVGGGRTRSPLGAGIVSWWWAPSGHLLYGLDRRGQVVSAAPAGGRPRVVASGVSSPGSASLSPDGRRLAIQSVSCQPAGAQLVTIDLTTGQRRVVLTRPHAPATLAGWSPDGRWLLFWAQAQCSASLSADGWPLDAVPAGGGTPSRAVTHMLLYPDFLTWCGRTLIAASTPSRETQLASRLVSTAPPSWRQHTVAGGSRLSWVSPTCAPSGKLLAAAAGSSTQNAGFGAQHRSIWLLSGQGRPVRRLTTPLARGLSDEAPRFSHNGRWILFVRSQVLAAGLNTSSRDTLELVPAARSEPSTPVPLVQFTSGDFSFYDHFSWPTEIDWSSP